MQAEFENLKSLASHFLEVADELNVQVSAYLDGSNKSEDVRAYYKVKDANKLFIDAYNKYSGEHYDYCLYYELAESVIG